MATFRFRPGRFWTRAFLSTSLCLPIAACAENGTGPSERPTFETIASTRWNAIARGLVSRYRTDPPLASRIYTLLSVAQDRAVTATAEFQSARRALDHAAVVGASAVVLAYAYPWEMGMLDSLAHVDLGNPLWSADTLVSVALADSMGRAIAGQLITERSDDGSATGWIGTVPTGPGMWFSTLNPPQPPLRPTWGAVRPWFLARGNQIRPLPPPAFGSAEFLSALSEVRLNSDTRTPRQLDIVKHWADGSGTYTPPGHWNQIAADLVTWYNLSESDAARVFSFVNRAMMDAGIAAWDAKYTYWLLRPSQADPAITLPIPLPNFPSYVSGHSAFSGAAAQVLAYFFPHERGQLLDQAEEAAISRVYAGIHFRFDSEVGLSMGRAVADLALEADRTSGGHPFEVRLARATR